MFPVKQAFASAAGKKQFNLHDMTISNTGNSALIHRCNTLIHSTVQVFVLRALREFNLLIPLWMECRKGRIAELLSNSSPDRQPATLFALTIYD